MTRAYWFEHKERSEAGQPTVSVAIELEAEWTPSRHPQIDQAQLGVHEVEVVMQAFAGIRPQEGAMTHSPPLPVAVLTVVDVLNIYPGFSSKLPAANCFNIDGSASTTVVVVAPK
jgi:hypothetical protein